MAECGRPERINCLKFGLFRADYPIYQKGGAPSEATGCLIRRVARGRITMSDAIEGRWQRLSEFLDQALELTDPEERARWLAAL